MPKALTTSHVTSAHHNFGAPCEFVELSLADCPAPSSTSSLFEPLELVIFKEIGLLSIEFSY